jgi:hypothetical protein
MNFLYPFPVRTSLLKKNQGEIFDIFNIGKKLIVTFEKKYDFKKRKEYKQVWTQCVSPIWAN